MKPQPPGHPDRPGAQPSQAGNDERCAGSQPTVMGRAIAATAFVAPSWSLATGWLSLAGVALVSLLGHEPVRWWFRSR